MSYGEGRPVAITIGQPTERDFTDPLGLLGDCHRRIESFLAVLIDVTNETRGAGLDEERRAALRAALRYFREAAPNHTRDEEESLFPRMRASDKTRIQTTLARLECAA